MAPLDRRRFLLGAGGLALMAACGRDGPDVSVDSPPKPGSPEDQLNLVVASYVHLPGTEQRVTVALLQGDTSPLKPDGPVEVTIDGQAVRAELHSEGIFLPYLLMRHRFPAPGVAMVEATYRGRRAKAALQVKDPAANKVPFPGQPMIRVPTPTVADPRGVDPICTRQPACPLHDVSLDAALGEKRPIALLFSTPAYCESRLCGPVLDNLLAQREAFADRVRFIHAEIYTSSDLKTLADPVKAYGLDNEPFLFLAGADGIVRERLDNAFDVAELRSALQTLAS
jgi:hypothetical protein